MMAAPQPIPVARAPTPSPSATPWRRTEHTRPDATAVNLNGATIKNGAGNVADLSLTGLNQGGPHIDTTTPVINSIAEIALER